MSIIQVGARPANEPTRAASSGRGRLGEILREFGAISEAQLEHALAQQAQLKLPLGKVLLKLNYVTDETVRQALAKQLNIPYIDLEKVTLDRQLARVINRSYARRHSLLPIAQVGRTLTVAMDDPTAAAVIDELMGLTSFGITVVTSSSRAIQRAFRRLYEDSVAETTETLGADLIISSVDAPAEASPPSSATRDEGATRRADELFRQILFRALEQNCSDIHLEMLPSGLHVRYRIDGVLRQPHFGPLQDNLDQNMREITSRIRILCKLDIAERRRPQDGSFQVSLNRGGNKVTIDLRVSVIPSYSGESVVIRILDQTRAPRSIAALDLSPVVSSRLEELIQRPTGILLVTGPTGSGKSTTLYACLMKLHRPEIRILTAEDPVEYVYEELSQAEVNEDIGNTFAAYLRAFLRHDPEIIMVGEIRDQETAEIAFRAAQTGHLLLSTLHTNSAIAALPRILPHRGDITAARAPDLPGLPPGIHPVANRAARVLRDGAPRPRLLPGGGLRRLRLQRLQGTHDGGRPVGAGRSGPWPDHPAGALRRGLRKRAAHHLQHGPGRARAAAHGNHHGRGVAARAALRRHRGASREIL